MRMLAAAFLMLIPFAAAHDSLECPSRGTYIVQGDGVSASTVYHVDYERDFDFTGDDWFYLESGARPGVQTGADHVVLGTLWVHDHRCVHYPFQERDDLVY